MHPRHRNDDRKSTRIGGAHWHGQVTRQLRKTATRNSHNKQARAHTISIFRLQRPNFPKTRHQRPTRRRKEHPRHTNDDRKSTKIWDCSLAWAGCATIAKTEQKHEAAATDRRVGTLDKHLPSPTTKFPQNAPRGRPIESDEEDNDDDGRSVDLHVPLPAPPPPAPRVLAPPLPLMTEPTHAKGGASGASATGMALASPPPRHRRPIHSVTTRTTTTKGARSMRTTSTCPRAPTAARAARARAAAADDDRADARGARPVSYTHLTLPTIYSV